MLLLASTVLALPAYVQRPDLHGDLVVFASGGDLWTVSTAGGTARALTSHLGTERNPHFSPDGRWVAYTAEYDGNPEVYLIPSTGGEPRRLTWNPADDQVTGFTPDGRSVVFRSRRSDPNARSWWTYTVPVTGGDATRLEIGFCAWLDIDPATGRYAFTRTGRDTATWKRYRGGTADELWVGDPARGEFAQVTDFAGLDAFPMWFGGDLYFLSDYGGTARLWRMKPDGSGRTVLTQNVGWDIRQPAMGPDGRIVYALAGDLHVFDPTAGTDRAVAVDVPTEAALTRVRYTDAESQLTAWDLSPAGDRVLLTTRGEIWAVPVEDGPALPVSHDTPERESWAGFSGDGKRVLYVTDVSGEEAIAERDAWGRGAARTVIPAGAAGWHFAPLASPDDAWIAWGDQTHSLYVAPSKGGTPRVVDHADQAEITQYAWSPDGRWLAYTKLDRRDMASVWIYDTRDQQSRRVSGNFTSDHTPTWDPDGRYLYFLSERHTDPVLGARDFEYILTETTVVGAWLLRPDVENPLLRKAGLPAPDAGPPESKGKKADKGKKKDEEPTADPPKPGPVEIQFEGLSAREILLPLRPAQYWGLGATADGVFTARAPVRGMVSADPGQSTLLRFGWTDKKETVFVDGVHSFIVSRENGKVGLRTDGGTFVVDAGAPPSPEALEDGRVKVDDVVVTVDPRAEWRQIYLEAWRLARDFNWEPAMGGVDWRKVRDQYATLLPRITTRGELVDLIGEVIGELASGHTYVWGGDPGLAAPGVSIGLLGADTQRVPEGWKLTRIYRGDPADEVTSPLQVPGAEVREGEYILEVNHRAPGPGESLEQLLSDRAGRPVVLTVNTRPTLAGARVVVVTPVADDHALRYSDWVRRNREYVAAKTGGKVGYLHIPDMGAGGLVAFDTWFYPQLDKQAMVVDVRWNGGGFVSQLILERLRRELIGFDRSRGGSISTYPNKVLNGPFVVLTNEFAGSDGDIFPYSVQQEKLAPVIGKRSWGGVIGIRADKPLVDGGVTTQPEYAHWWPAHGWAVENHGVDPDIEVANRPQDLAQGLDPQLDRGIAEVLALLAQHPPVAPAFGPEPTKNRETFEQKEK